MRARYRVGVIGHTGRGNYGHGLDRVWLDLPECEVVAVADADQAGLAAAAKRLKTSKAYSDYRKMFEQCRLDVVSIGPRWLDQHAEMVVAAAAQGTHIYLEKPMCRSLQEADHMVAACERNRVKLAIAFQTRYSPVLPVIEEVVLGGKIGQVMELRGRGKEDRRGGGEDLWVLGSHILNLMHHFGGEPHDCLASVLQDGRAIRPDDIRPGNEGIGPLAGDNVRAMYGLDHGASGYFASQRNLAGGRFGLQVFGSLGVVEILTGYLTRASYLPDPSWSPGRSGKRWIRMTSAGIGKDEPLSDGGLHAGNILACKDLLAAIEDDRQPEASIYEARTTVEMISAVFESQRLGRAVRIPLENRKHPLESDFQP